MAKKSRQEQLAESSDMTPVQGTVDVDVPVEELWALFSRADWWARWNKCFFWALNKDLVSGRQLIWIFEPIRRWYLYKMFAIAKIVEVRPESKVTWEVTALPGFYARHTYHMEDLGDGRTRFGSWEKAMGWGFRLLKRFWLAHFTFVKDKSLEGARLLENIYQQEGELSDETLPRKRYWLFLLVLLLILLIAIGAGWFYRSFVRQSAVELAPGVYAVLGGGGNSLIVDGGDAVLLVDSKFPPGSRTLRNWVSANIGHPVTHLVNTHYHYDHTQGNILHDEAKIYAHEKVPELMRARDGSFWSENQSGIPTQLVADMQTLQIGDRQVVLRHPGPGHTQGDLWVHLPSDNIVATGDLLFHSYYPFFDLGKGGVSIPELEQVLRRLAENHPEAVFVPGHGPPASSGDLRDFADYLSRLYRGIENARNAGLTQDEAVAAVDLSAWDHLSILPSFHNLQLTWATAGNNKRWVYQLLEARAAEQGAAWPGAPALQYPTARNHIAQKTPKEPVHARP